MNLPRRPRLPEAARTPPPDRPHPLRHPDERKEGGPDFGKENLQREKALRDRRDADRAAEEGPPGLPKEC